MKLQYLLISVILLINCIGSAECLKPVTHLSVNELTPCEGYLFSPEKELEVRLKVGSYDQLSLINSKQRELIDTIQQRINIQIEQNLLLVNQLQEREKNDFWKQTGFFLSGVLITTIISYGLIKTIK